MTRLPFIVDGVDFSTKINRLVYSVGYEKREGSTGGLMLDGSETVDILAFKAVVTVYTNALTESEVTALFSALLKPYVQLTYRDLRTGSDRTATFIPDVDAAEILLIDGQTPYFSEFGITLRER